MAEAGAISYAPPASSPLGPLISPSLGMASTGGSNGQQNAEAITKSGAMLVAVEGKIPFPYLEIVEQPRQRGFRFRYPCEGPSHGGLPGEKSEKHRKSYPTVRLHHYLGRAKVVVSLVTSDDPAKPHAHRLIGRAVQNGICSAEVGPECEFKTSFNLGILHATKKNVGSNLLLRYALTASRLPGSKLPETGDVVSWPAYPQDKECSEVEILEKLGEERKAALLAGIVKEGAAGMNLSVVRLCFQAYLEGPEHRFEHALPPVISQPVFDSKAPSSSSLKICRMDKFSGSVAGNDEVFLLCDRVQKDDVEVVLYDGPADGSDVKWSALGLFSSSDVHRQFSIVFRTPPYHNLYAQSVVCVWLALRRKSDSEQSEPKSFIYQPLNMDPEKLTSKRLKSVPNFSTEDYPCDGAALMQQQQLQQHAQPPTLVTAAGQQMNTTDVRRDNNAVAPAAAMPAVPAPPIVSMPVVSAPSMSSASALHPATATAVLPPLQSAAAAAATTQHLLQQAQVTPVLPTIPVLIGCGNQHLLVAAAAAQSQSAAIAALQQVAAGGAGGVGSTPAPTTGATSQLHGHSANPVQSIAGSLPASLYRTVANQNPP